MAEGVKEASFAPCARPHVVGLPIRDATRASPTTAMSNHSYGEVTVNGEVFAAISF